MKTSFFESVEIKEYGFSFLPYPIYKDDKSEQDPMSNYDRPTYTFIYCRLGSPESGDGEKIYLLIYKNPPPFLLPSVSTK